VLSLDGPGGLEVRVRCTRAVLRHARSSAFSVCLLIPWVFRPCVSVWLPSGTQCVVLDRAQHKFAWGTGERLCPLFFSLPVKLLVNKEFTFWISHDDRVGMPGSRRAQQVAPPRGRPDGAADGANKGVGPREC
jgi:hypothetical protein